MKIKLDENMPCDRLLASGFVDDIDTVEQEGLAGSDDATVWEAAQREGGFLITQDLDFADMRSFTPGTHHGVLLVRLRAPSRRRLNERLEFLLGRRDEFESWRGCFVVATDSKVRVRRPAAAPPEHDS